MRHLRLVQDPTREPPASPDDPPVVVTQLHLALAGVPEPDPVFPGEVESPPPVLPEPDPQLQALFGQMDLLMDGLSGEERLAFARTFYIDADRQLQARSLKLRLA